MVESAYLTPDRCRQWPLVRVVDHVEPTVVRLLVDRRNQALGMVTVRFAPPGRMSRVNDPVPEIEETV